MTMRFSTALCGTAIALVIGLGAAGAFADDNDDTASLQRALEKEGKKLEAQEKALQAQQKKLDNEQAEFEALKAKIEKATGKKVTSNGTAGAAASETAQNTNAAPPDEVGTDRKPVTPEKPPEVAKYIEEGGVLMPKGRLEIAPSIEYDRLSSTNVAIEGFSIIPALNIGTFNVSQVNRDILMGAVQARYGLTSRVEIEGKIPYVYGSQDTVGRVVGVGTTQDTSSNIGGEGLGDIEFGAHYQINQGQNGWPYFIANLRYKSDTGTGPFEIPLDTFGLPTKIPTGSGFNAIQPSVTFIYPSDPVVFYGNMGYVHSFERSFATYGTIDPGDAITASFGMSMGLNDAASWSIGYSHSMVFDTTQDGHVIPGSYYLQVGSVDLGYAYALNDWMALNLTVSAGVTSDAPDDRVILRVPMQFDILK